MAGGRLIVELDGWEAHRTRADFERDRTRDRALAVAGYQVVRITWRMVVYRPGEVVRDLRELRALAATPRSVPMLHSVK